MPKGDPLQTGSPERERRPGSAPGRLGSRVAYLYAGLLALLGAMHAMNYPDFYRHAKPPLFDAHAYWLTGQENWIPYSLPPGTLDAFLYSPAFAQLISLITWLPWPAFASLWLGLELATFIWLLKPLGWVWGGVGLLWCVQELYIGNIYAFLAAATVLALTGHPQAWALPALTKPVLAVGALWHLVRREFRAFGTAVAATAGVVAVSYVIDPGLWHTWIHFLVDAALDSAAPSYKWRVLGAIGIVVLAAILDRKWLVPFGMLLALPIVGSLSAFTLLAAVPRLVLIRSDKSSKSPSDVQESGLTRMERQG